MIWLPFIDRRQSNAYPQEGSHGGIEENLFMKRVSVVALMLALSQSSCIVVGGYSSEGGWYIWPGSILSILVIVIVFLLLRRRK